MAKSDKLTKQTQFFLVRDLILLADTADPSERRRIVESILADLNIEPENRQIGESMAKTRQIRAGKAGVTIAKDEQVKLLGLLLDILDGNNGRDHEAVYQASLAIKNMFTFDADARQEASERHHDEWSKKQYSQALVTPAKDLPKNFDDMPAMPEVDPEPDVVPATKLPTHKMRRSVEDFDRLNRGEQIDELRSLWADDGEAMTA